MSQHAKIYKKYSSMGGDEYTGQQPRQNQAAPPQRENFSNEQQFSSSASSSQQYHMPSIPSENSIEVLEIQTREHRRKVLTENFITCIDLWAQWCTPCVMIKPAYKALAAEYNNPGSCMLVQENVDLGLSADDYTVSGIPCFLFYKRGVLVRDEKNEVVTVVGGDLKKVRFILDKLLAQTQTVANPLQTPPSSSQRPLPPKQQMNSCY
jgi:thiol-disulfide isomerase/thioredoxin